MFADQYLLKSQDLLEKIRTTQMGAIQEAAQVMAKSIAAGRAVHLFGSGHSVIPVLDIFPRYGSYPGFHPVMDPRLMWFNITGPGGARELLWLERTEGYVKNVLLSHHLDPRDTMIVYSHGGLNAAPVEMALEAKARGVTVVAVTSVANHKINKPTHSSGKSLYSAADIVIDNCVEPEDALISVDGLKGNVAASSTLSVVAISMALVAETTGELARLGKLPERVFVSPNVAGVPKTNNERVFRDYEKFESSL
ncbi:MAG TPA: sugar isomerase domain-containing protein [Anaerolineales bacterium]